MNLGSVGRRIGITRSDVGLSAALLLLGYWNLWFEWETFAPGMPRNLPLDSVTVALATGALLFRRRAPLATMAVVNGALFVPDLFVPTGLVFLGEWIPSLLAAYSVALYRGGAWNAVPFAAAAGAFAVFGIRYSPTFGTAPDAAVWFIPVLVAVAAGHAARTMGHRLQEFAREAAALEAEQAAKAEQAVTDERARIAREMHDVIARSVSIMVVQAGAAEHTMLTDPVAARDALVNVQTAGREALEEMRLLLGVLRDPGAGPMREPAPSLVRLDALIGPFRASGMQVTVETRGTGERVPPAVDVSAYRVLQEALTNALKHAPGCEARVRVEVTPVRVLLEVRNSGATGAPPEGGFGLIGLRERIALHGGRLDAGCSDGEFVLYAELPIVVAP